MSLFRPQRTETRSDHPTDNFFEMLRRRMRPSETGQPVDTMASLTHSAVYECVDLISDLVAGFPVDRYRNGSNGRTKIEQRLQILDEPSTEIDDLNWRKTLVSGWLLRGYTPGLITSMRKGYPTGIELVHPDRMRIWRDRPDAPCRYAVDGVEMKRWPKGRLWIASGKTLFPGDPVGSSVLEFARAEVGMGIAARSLGASFYRDGAIPTAILRNTGQELDKDGARRVKQRFYESLNNTREPVVLGKGWEYEQIQISPNESQFLESIKANRTIVAGFFRVPPNLIGAPAGTGMTYQNVEHQGIYLIQFTIGPWVQRMERVLTGLTVRPEYVRLDIDNLLRTDLPNRYRAHDIAIRAGFKSVNEAREVEDLAPIPDGDRYIWPPYRTQLSAAELAGLVDAGPDAAEFGLFGDDRGTPVDPNAVGDSQDMVEDD